MPNPEAAPRLKDGHVHWLQRRLNYLLAAEATDPDPESHHPRRGEISALRASIPELIDVLVARGEWSE